MFGKTLKDLKGVASTVSELLGEAPTKRYPPSIGETARELITNQPKYDSGDWKSSRGYIFTVVEVNKVDNSISESPAKSKGWQEFRLQINPQEISQDEVFAIQVTPTFRGVVVEHQGVTIKDISISGTTGLSPNRAEGGAMPKSGNPVFQVGTSGFEEFHELRSYFRMYVESKRQEPKNSPTELRLMFSNLKDNEYLFVEPQKFSMKRSAAKSTLYDYAISMKAVGVATPNKNASFKWYESVDNWLEKAQGYFDLAYQVLNASSGIISRFQRNFSSTVLGPLQSLNRAILAIRGGAAMNFGEFGITRRYFKDFADELAKVHANFADVMGKKSEEYNQAVGRTSTLSAPLGRSPTYNELQISNALQAAVKGTVLVTSLVELFEPDIFQTNATVLESFPNSGISAPNSISTSSIQGGDNIQTIALRELGDIDKFKDIIILNNLKPPYISATGGPGVLKPGDKILIPKTNASGSSSVARNVQYNITKTMQQAERDLGVDIRLTDDGDLAIASNKDLDLVAGVENLVQAIAIKLFLEKLSLKRHPQVGTNLQLGTKLRANSLTALRKEITDSLGSDNRVESIPFVELRQEGGTIYVNMLIKIKEIEQPIPLPLTLNVG
jgi:hypothetical protein